MANIAKSERYKKNPFRETVIKNTITGTTTIYGSPTGNTESFAMTNKETGEYTGDITFGKRIKVDKSGFVKMYANGIRMFLGLTSAGIKVFMIIFDEMMNNENYAQDKIELVYELLDENIQNQISRATFFRGIKELVKANFLAPSIINGIWWINADYMFRGKRLTLVNQYILEDNEEAKKTGDSVANIRKTNRIK